MKGAAIGAGIAATDLSFVADVGLAATNAILTENTLAGSADWDLGYIDDTIEGFPTEFSVNAGTTIGFKIKTVSKNYRIDIYRIGWYGGVGARKVTTIPRVLTSAQVQPAPIRNAALGLVDCGNWAVSATWSVPSAAVSGVYVANFVRLDVAGQPASRALFVVRNDGRQSDILVQTSDSTYQAYNRWGGTSLYSGDNNTQFGRAVKVSYNRPMSSLELENDFYYAELPLVRWLERNGFDVTYTSCVDTERRPAELLKHKIFVSSGHDEYWSGGMRANVEAARDAGVNLIFMTGNEVFWKMRWESSIDGTGTPYKTLVCYKETLDNAKIDPSTEWTGTWRDPRFSPPSNGGRPENALTGTLFKAINSVDDIDFAIEVPYEYSRLRIWRSTSIASLAPGTKATLTNATLGYEWDTDGDFPGRPAGLIRLSETTQTIDQVLRDYGKTYTRGPLTHYLTMYRAASGALVWGTGTVQWAWGLDDYHTNRPVFAVPVDPRIQQATLNVLADMGAQPASRQSGLVTASKSTDVLPPVSTLVSPAAGSSVQIGSGVTLTGTAVDSGGGRVAAVEVSVDGGTSWHPAVGRESWSYTFVPTAIGNVNIKVRAIDDSCNREPDDAGVNLVAVARTLPGSLWNQNVFPTVPAADDASALELGLRFVSAVDGFVTGVRFYKGAGNVGQHVGRVWTASGSLLASAPFTGESATGWQTVMFGAPVAVKAGTNYVVSYSAPAGHYAADANYFATAYDLAPLTAPANGSGGANGVFATTPGGFPSSTFGASNYWVDPIFDTDDGRPPSVVSTSPGIGVSQVGAASSVTATFSEPLRAGSVTLSLAGSAGPVAGTTSYDSATRTATFVPSAPLNLLTQYVATVSAAVDIAGTAMSAPFSWTFTTAGAPGTLPTSVWTSSDAPQISSADDTSGIEVGVKFKASVAGLIGGLRFYKGDGNGGTHVGHLWNAAGQLLGAVTFAQESQIGWQEATFATPIPINANTVYVASYFAPEGHYAVSAGQFTGAAVTRGPLQAVDGTANNGNGVYRYGTAGGFPMSSYGNANYWVDVVFTRPPDVLGPAVVTSTPAANLQGVGVAEVISVGFDKSIKAGATFTVSDPGGHGVAGAVTYDDPSHTLSFTPSAPLAAGVVHSGNVSATATNNVAMTTPYAWSFTTATAVGECPATIWTTSASPATSAADDSNPIEIGVKFRADIDGAVSAIRFFKGPGNVGAHVGHLWRSTGELLGTVAFSAESAAGWQQANFATPIGVSAGQTYVASYFAPTGHYAVTTGDLTNTVDRLPLHAPSSASVGGNGVFAYGPGSFPSGSFQGSNYWVDVVFVDSTGPSVSSRFPASNAVGVATNAVVTATFNEAVQAASPTIDLRDAQGATVSGSKSYEPTSRTITFAPSAPLATGSTYTASVSGARDLSGNLMSGATSWAFTTTGGSTVSLFGSATPPVESASDTDALELGMRFRSTASGRIHGVRFYKGAANLGSHVGHLWAADGTLLATASFDGESPGGWQFAAFTSPVDIVSGTDYVVSYSAPQGGYAVAGGYFGAGDIVNGPLIGIGTSVSTPNGLYRYGAGGGFPTNSWNGSNYWVDVEFEPNAG